MVLNSSDVDKFKKLGCHVLGLCDEMSILSKKSPNDAGNKFKSKFINRQLRESNTLVGDRYRPFDDFEVSDEDAVPQNSDVVFSLSQYLQCMEKLRGDYVIVGNGTWYWKVLGRARSTR